MVDIEKHDEFARSLCSDQALTLIDGLPALLKLDELSTLREEVVEALNNHAQSIMSIEGLAKLSPAVVTDEMKQTAIRYEYLARLTVVAYIAEIESREKEARLGLH
ncbi:hypothetical protein [Rhizobium sp. Leaf453]|uniref:hypothetical protein n=1 Tax=Rhizobium sp. Leaf453 TaxID=1736380 RepID=UPI000712A219|nr:hypothetical protein [Rhizobium sp. Leaf453]KQT96980.1 hypothetical protein ASG68_08465 [Rhizobium sp. Leaf453]